MLKIRLQRIGKRGQAYFRLVVTEHTTKPQGKYLELLGSYDPHKKELKVDGERVGYWLSRGAQMSETANNLLVDRKIIEGEKVKAWRPKKKGKGEEKTQAEPVIQKPAETSAAESQSAPERPEEQEQATEPVEPPENKPEEPKVTASPVVPPQI